VTLGAPVTSACSMLVRKQNFVDDVYDAISVEDVTVSHSGVIHLKNRVPSAGDVRAQSAVRNG
jgi:hypothetical protein